MSARQGPAFAGLLIAVLCWSGNALVGRAFHDSTPPLSLSFWRWVLATSLLLPFVAKGIWAHRASQGENAALEPISDEQLHQALQTAQSIGDDNIQRRSGGQVDPDAWTHGSSEQRMQAFKSGYESGKMSACDTLNRGVYKG